MDLPHLAPKQPAWLGGTVLVALASCLTVAGAAWGHGVAPGRGVGLMAGTVAAAIVLIDLLYPLRRRLMRWPLTSAQRWLQFHVYGGALALVLALLHVGARWPVGRLGWALVGTGVWSAAGGLAGVLLQKRLPATLAGLSVEARYEGLPLLVEQLRASADRLMTGAPDALDRVYQAAIRPTLSGIQLSWSYLADIESVRRRRLAPLNEVEAFVADTDRARIDDLAAIVSEKLDLDAHGSLQRVLRQWLVLHVPAACLFAALLALHILFAVSY